MSDLILDAALVADLETMKAELRKLFNDLKIADYPDVEHRMGGKERLERVPAFQKKNFEDLITSNHRFLLKRIAAMLTFLSDEKPLTPLARLGLNATLIDPQLNRLRATPLWVNVRERLEEAAGPPKSADERKSKTKRKVAKSKAPLLLYQGSKAAPFDEAGDYLPSLWQELSVEDFALPESERNQQGINFVQGAQLSPLWTAIAIAVPRKAMVEQIKQVFDRSASVVILHGPAGQGKSTVGRQLAMEWFQRGRVFEISDSSALTDLRLIQAIEASPTTPLLLIDDVSLSEIDAKAIRLFRPLRFERLKVLVTVQSRFRDPIKRALGDLAVDFSLGDPDPAEKEAILDLICGSRPDQSRADIARLFNQGFSGPFSGLWPAMYQATRGEGLVARMERIVSEIEKDKSKLVALASTVFLNRVRDTAPDYKDLQFHYHINRRLVLAFIEHSPWNPEAKLSAKESLTSIFDWFEREIIGSSVHSMMADPLLNLRHPAVTEALAASLFGGPETPRIDEWQFFEPLARALATPEAAMPTDRVTRAADCISLLYAVDRAERKKLLKGLNLAEFIKAMPSDQIDIYSVLTDIALSLETTSRPVDRARAMIWKAALDLKIHRIGTPAAEIYLERCLDIVRDQPTGDVCSNIAVIIEQGKITLTPDSSGKDRNPLYFRSRFL